MQLYFKKYGNAGKPIIILHGLFGMLDNWHNIARYLSESHIVYTVDQRNHGQSPHSPVMNFGVMADDIWELMNSERIPTATLIGHSMGGKTAMMFANKYPEKIDKLVVVDIAPKSYMPSHTIYFEALRSLDLGLTSRKDIEEQLSKTITDPGEMLFLLKNLYRKEDGTFGLKMNLEAIEKNYHEIIREIAFGKTLSMPACFIKGEFSKYIKKEDEEAIKTLFTKVSFETIAGAGHWVHAENPEGFLQALNRFLNSD